MQAQRLALGRQVCARRAVNGTVSPVPVRVAERLPWLCQGFRHSMIVN